MAFLHNLSPLKYLSNFSKYIPEWLITPEDSRGEISLFTGDIGLENEDVGKEVVDDISSPYDFRLEKSITLRSFLGGFDDSSILFVSTLTGVLFSILTFFLRRFFLNNRFYMEKSYICYAHVSSNIKSKIIFTNTWQGKSNTYSFWG